MSNRPGDPAKRPPECGEPDNKFCPHMRETSSRTDFDGETYNCEVCGRYYRLYYEDMA